MKFRLAAVAALALGIALGTSGCNLIQPQATTKSYNASDGVSVSLGSLQLRNLIILSDDGQLGSLMLNAVNTGDRDVTFTASYVAAGVTHSVTNVAIAGQKVVNGWGDRGEQQIILEQIATAPGAMLEVVFSDGVNEKTTLIPVLTTAQPEYSGLGPVSPTPTVEPTIIPEPTLTAEPTPAETPAAN